MSAELTLSPTPYALNGTPTPTRETCSAPVELYRTGSTRREFFLRERCSISWSSERKLQPHNRHQWLLSIKYVISSVLERLARWYETFHYQQMTWHYVWWPRSKPSYACQLCLHVLKICDRYQNAFSASVQNKPKWKEQIWNHSSVYADKTYSIVVMVGFVNKNILNHHRHHVPVTC